MRKKLVFFYCLLSAIIGVLPAYAQNSGHRIALITDHIDKKELAAVKLLLDGNSRLTYEEINFDMIQREGIPKRFSQLWYHRTDTTAFDKREIAAGAPISSFVRNGGHVFLSMEAVGLLNSWKIEHVPFQLRTDTLRDEGFGRPAGFHSFKSHPLFAGLNGGVYSTKQTADHEVRKHGFFDASVPQEGRVVGIDWTYITYSEQNKLLLEYTLGKGAILAAGAYLYFAVDNNNREQLRRFTENVFAYLSGQPSNIKKHYWNYEPRVVRETDFGLNRLEPVPATKWMLPSSALRLSKKTASRDFYDLVGRRMLWMGTMNAGAEEIWVHPYMALRDFQVGIKFVGSDSVQWLNNFPASIDITPEYIVRTYRVRNTELKEIYTVSYDKPMGIAHFEIAGNDLRELVVQSASTMRYMWPYSPDATGSIYYNFDAAVNGHVISAQQGDLNTIVSYSSKPVYQSIQSAKANSQVKMLAAFSASDQFVLNVTITGGSEGLQSLMTMLTTSLQESNDLFARTNGYYKRLLNDHLNFETPDLIFNIGYKWALARTDQFVQTTPGIGTGLMAGYGTTAGGWNGNQAISGRPGYAWYFGRDGELTAMAMNAYGDFPTVREAMETFIRFQDVNGKVYHELTSSGAVHYDAADATPLLVVLAAEYLKYTGDLDYIRLRWPDLKKAMDFCYSTDTDHDGLIENTNVGHGWIEGGVLFGAHSEFYLTGIWAAALNAAAYMADNLGLNEEAGGYARDAIKIKKIIDTDFWNPAENFFYNGKTINGLFLPHVTVLASVPVYLNAVIDKAKAEKVSQRFSNNEFSTPWGIRMVEDSCSYYDAGNYQDGTVRSLDGGWAALSEYSTGHYRSAYEHVMNSLVQFQQWSLGSIQEATGGDVYKPSGVCMHQAWSESMVVQPAIEGMLGLKPDAMRNHLQLSPYFPWNWNFCKVQNIRMKTTTVALDMHKKEGETHYRLTASKVVSLNFNPVFPLNTQVKSVTVNGKNIRVRPIIKPQGILVPLSFDALSGDNEIRILTSGGIGALPVPMPVMPGDTASNLQIISEKIAGKKYIAEMSGRPNRKYEFTLFCKEKIKAVKGADIIGKDADTVTIRFRTGAERKGSKYGSATITVLFR